MISNTIQTELQQCKNILDASYSHENLILNEALGKIKNRSGKMMRPILVLLTTRLFGNISDNAILTAAAYEAFHTASLIHDDVVDESDERRGQESLNYAEGNKVAVLVGDYILANSLKFLAKTESCQLLNIITDTAQELANGELLQLSNISDTGLSENTYFNIIRSKTAALFSACAESAAIVAGANSNDIDIMRKFGEAVGICFQIKDDIFDIQDDDIGKPTGNDLREGKITLPTLYALKHSKTDTGAIIHRIKTRVATDDEIIQLVEFTKRHGGIEYAVSVMENYAHDAIGLLDIYPHSPAKQALCEYVDYVIGRKY